MALSKLTCVFSPRLTFQLSCMVGVAWVCAGLEASTRARLTLRKVVSLPHFRIPKKAHMGLVLPSSQAMRSLRRQDAEEPKKVTVVLTPPKHAFHAFRRLKARSFDFVVKTSSAPLYPRALKAWAINLCHSVLNTEDSGPQIPKNPYRIVEATRL